MSTPEPVLAICVNWNGRDVLRETVQSLLSSDYPKLDIVVVDNASSDDSLACLPSSTRVIRLNRNAGYGGALNCVVRPLLRTELPPFFLLLNNDVVLAQDTVRILMECARGRGPGVFGPRIVRFDDPTRLEAAWGEVSWSHVLARYHGKNDPKSDPRWQQITEAELLLGSALLVHRQVFEKVGLFDENFFMYHEEVDFLYRARRQGLPVLFCPCAEVTHHGAHSTRSEPLTKIFWVRRNTVYFLRKHRAGTWQWSYYWATLVLSLASHGFGLRWSRLATISRAVKEGFSLNDPH